MKLGSTTDVLLLYGHPANKDSLIAFVFGHAFIVVGNK